jgi:acyl-CoA thioester hydrolase
LSPEQHGLRSRRGRHVVRVAYFDTDKAGVVHHASYLRFLEVARVEYWRALGFDYNKFEQTTGLGLPVVEARLKYKLSARFDDELEVETWVSNATRASVWLSSVVRRGPDVVLEASVRFACCAFTDGTIRRIPDAVLDACLEARHGV